MCPKITLGLFLICLPQLGIAQDTNLQSPARIAPLTPLKKAETPRTERARADKNAPAPQLPRLPPTVEKRPNVEPRTKRAKADENAPASYLQMLPPPVEARPNVEPRSQLIKDTNSPEMSAKTSEKPTKKDAEQSHSNMGTSEHKDSGPLPFVGGGGGRWYESSDGSSPPPSPPPDIPGTTR